MRIVWSHSRNGVWKILKVLIEKSFLPRSNFLAFHWLQLLFNLLISFVKIIISRTRFLSIFLLHLNSLNVSVFDKALVNFIVFSFFTISLLIERIFEIVMWRLRNLFHSFYMIVHIEASSGFVSRIWLAFNFLVVFSLCHLLDWVNILS